MTRNPSSSSMLHSSAGISGRSASSSFFMVSVIGLIVCCTLFLLNGSFMSAYFRPQMVTVIPMPNIRIDESRKASNVLKIPVYISLTTISSRIHQLIPTLRSVVHGDLVPDQLYIFLSNEKFLLDEGISIDDIKTKAPDLIELMKEYPMISIAFTANEGPHRKLLPLLAKKWTEDCVIVTIDDHETYGKTMLSSLVHGYRATNGTAVIALRSRRIAYCDEGSGGTHWTTMPYSSAKGRGLWPEVKSSRLEMLLLPTGMGGVLYRPRFMHPVVFDDKLREVTKTTDDLSFRLSAMATGTPVYAVCNHDQHPDCVNTLPYPMKKAYASEWKFAPNVMNGAQASSVASVKTERFKTLASWDVVTLSTWLSPTNASQSSSQAPATARTLLRKSRRLFSAREEEPAKKISLASQFNNVKAGNTHNWANGTKYLHDMGIFDYPSYIQYAVKFERGQCMLSSGVWSVIPAMLESYIQYMYDANCGIEACM
jgi:hypothetical protein